ncbi:MAG: AMP-binding protein [Bacteroidaceae bacterium]|nr:AMP-binding protein [Bacteroidaceae bacterium]
MNERPTIIEFVEHYCNKFADKTFLREKTGDVWRETSFADTYREGRILAAGFMALGLQKGDRVSLISEGRNLWILTELGILFAGGVDVPLSTKLEETNDLLFRINHSDARFVVASAQQLPKIRKTVPGTPLVEKVIVLDNIEDLQENEMTIGQIRDMGLKFMNDNPGALDERIAQIGPDDPANITYTSGTTADPKGIILTHRNYTANVEQGVSVIDIPNDWVMLIVLPLDHCFAHVAGFYTMMYHGGSIATVPVGKTPMQTLRNMPIAIKEIKPHIMLSVPAISRNFKKNIEAGIKAKGPKVEKLYNFALKNAIAYNKEYYNRGGWQFWRWPMVKLFDKLIFKSVREGLGGRLQLFVGGGALLDIELQRYFCAIGIPIFQGYGLSEATPIICSNSPAGARFGSSGRTVKPMDIKICDSDGKEVAHGTRGEIVIRGENVMGGYWKNPESTASTIVDGWLHTGDMGYICTEDPRYLYVTGRFKSLLISPDGEKYSPEGFEDGLTDGSKYIDNTLLHNDMNPYTIALVVPNKEALKEYAAHQKPGIDLESAEAKEIMLKKIQEEVDSYRKGGTREGLFPERWLPAAIVVLPEQFTEKGGLVNSTMKVVRGKVEKFYADRIEYAYTPEGKNLLNEKNMASL